MSRLKQIQDEIIAAKENFTQLDGLLPLPDSGQQYLNDLASTSQVADWRHMCNLVAWAAMVNEGVVAKYMADVQLLLQRSVAMNKRWMIAQCYKWQFGYSLQWNNTTERYEYSAIDEAAQLVKLANATLNNGVMVFKVAKLSGNNPVKLTTPEYNAFSAYMNDVLPPGVYSFISIDADDLRVYFEVYVNPSVIYVNDNDVNDPLNGSLLTDPSTFPVKDALKAYIGGIDFDGTFLNSTAIDRMQAVEGVADVVNIFVQARSGSNNFISVNRAYVPNSGYLALDEAGSTFIYIKNV